MPVLRGVSMHVAPREVVALMGPSGSGKSTLLNILGCLDRPTRGHYVLGGRDVSTLSRTEQAWVRLHYMGFVFQAFHLIAEATVLENVALPLYYAGVARKQREHKARALLDRVGLADRLDHRPNQLSGGQRQRVAIARSLANGPRAVARRRADRRARHAHRRRSAAPALGPAQGELAHDRDRHARSRSRRVRRPHDPHPRRIDRIGRHGRDRSARMRFIDNDGLRMALQMPLRQPGRSALTTLGLAIGVGAFIAMVSFGRGARTSVVSQFETLGSNILRIKTQFGGGNEAPRLLNEHDVAGAAPRGARRSPASCRKRTRR